MNEPAVTIDTAEQVSVNELRDRIPHAKFVQVLTMSVVGALAVYTIFALLGQLSDTIRDMLIGAWIAMASNAVNFWLGSSSGGKLK